MSDPTRTVGYIGLGIMGAPMAANLLAAGYDLLVWNRTAAKARPLVDAGAQLCDSPADVARRGAQVVFLNVKDTPDVEAVLFGGDGVAAGAPAGTIIVDNSTISPVATAEFAARLAEQDVTLLDAPVSGGDAGARDATLSIMVGGPAPAFERVRPLLESLGRSVVHVGDSGAGQTCKACNQVAAACTLLGVCEAVALARKTGLDPDKMLEVVGGGAAASWQLTNLGPKIARGDHAPGFMVGLILKDLAIVGDTARSHQLPLPGAAMVEQLFRSVQAHGGGKLGTQALATALDRLAAR